MNSIISIGITCYNSEHSIKQAIECALNQDYENTEVIIVDDYSSDMSKEVISEFKSNPKVKIIYHEKNLGPAAARNTIVSNASGDYIAFFDDDDFQFKNRIRHQKAVYDSLCKNITDKPIIVFCSGERHYPNQYIKPLNAIGSKNNTPISGHELIDYLLINKKNPDLFYGFGTPTCAMFIKRLDILEIGGFDENLRRVEDVDITIRLAYKNALFYGDKNKLFIQYSTEGNDKTYEKNLVSELKVIEKNRTYLQKKGYYSYSRNWCKLRFYYFKKNYLLIFKTLLFLTIMNPIKTINHVFDTGIKRVKHDYLISKKII